MRSQPRERRAHIVRGAVTRALDLVHETRIQIARCDLRLIDQSGKWIIAMDEAARRGVARSLSAPACPACPPSKPG
jgi:hypothetical protein